jgi:Ti-type conjugative transfer relaxase TraA
MAIQFARVERVSRSNGKNACCKGSYNARSKIIDQKTNVVYNFTNRNNNVYHNILLPEYVDKKFKNLSELMNAIEHIERRNNSQLLKEYVLALPDDKNISLELKKEMIHAFIRENKWVEEGLAVQIDIHEPHDEEKNWHAHLLVTTRRFTKDGQRLGKKARDLDPQVRGGRTDTYVKSKDEVNIGNLWKDVQNRIFANHNLENRVDSISLNAQEYVGPVRMRSVMNAAVMRNEQRRIAEIEHLNSGARVLDKVTRNMSVFNKGDLIRAVKCIPGAEARARLVEDAMSDKSIIPLFTPDASKVKYYTTNEVRLEEQKIMRLSGYVANTENVIGKSGKIFDIASSLFDDARDVLSGEQRKALKELLLCDSGLRVLRGRAGTGKSHVLGKLASIADYSGINVIGVAPTHKARIELVKSGYERVDTVKGMLFKLANARFDLPKNSLIVVDEAGMIANSDYQELLRVAATRKCNIILSGDERQLSSVTRGGMFEMFADRYGSSTIFDIQRQDSNWGRLVAQSFANGNVRSGIAILEKEDRLKWHDDAGSSMQSLIKDWHNSDYALNDRVILAVKNKDVLALNHGVREYLKQEGKLSGREFSLIDSFYMKGDKILITQTSKKLGLLNGDVGEITYVSEYKFIIKLGEKEISFDPAEYNGFRHGYASTVFKSQGSSIKDVYVYHDGFSTIRNSYVSLSRHVNELNLYVNKGSTADMSHLARQLGNDFENSASLRYITQADHAMNQSNEQTIAKMSRIDKMMLGTYEFLEKNITKLADKYIPSSEYYNYVPPKQQNESVEQILDKTYAENQNTVFGERHVGEKLVVGDNVLKASNHDKQLSNVLSNVANIDSNNASTIKGAKSRFYSNVDYVRNRGNSVARIEQLKVKWDNEALLLRKEVSFKAEQIAREMLGEPNKHLSSGRELRFGDNGKIAVRISGEKAGTWYDFARGEGGDMFDLVKEARGGDFKEAVQYVSVR